MNVLFEDDGQLKAGSVLADNDASLQVEAVSGKRLKIKSGAVLLRFTAPSAGALMTEGQGLAKELDPDFLWEAIGDGEFGFEDLAREYFGAHPTPAQATAVAMLLHASPMYFYKKGKGRYRKAPPESLRAALASVERKQREAAQIAGWVDALAARRLPAEFAPKLAMLLYKPDKNSLEWKALAAACDAERTNPVDLLAACGAIPSTHDFHFNRFLSEAFPKGVAFPEWGSLPAAPDLPRADVRAFSIDDATTTEIDDAFSMRELANGNVEVGIHIACPALAMPRGSALDAIARERLSTVYMPGRKLTMLPEAAVAAFTLRAGAEVPALSLYIETDPTGAPVAHATRLNLVPVAANLNLATLSDAFANPLPAPDDPPWTHEMRALWKLAQHLSARRGKADFNRIDYSFDVDWGAGDEGRVTIAPRERGSPLDKLVAELMIHVNSTWGQVLAASGAAGLYRVQSGGKVKMSTRPGEHQGLGLTHYLWASSPLRRYCDLVNQRQLLAVVAATAPPYGENDAELFAALADFEVTYSQYAEFQDRMEQYWCLRWLVQENVAETTASVIRENLVRFDRLPWIQRMADLPPQPPETVVRVAIARVDLLHATLECRYAGTP
jgi:exoribonuclease-2